MKALRLISEFGVSIGLFTLPVVETTWPAWIPAIIYFTIYYRKLISEVE